MTPTPDPGWQRLRQAWQLYQLSRYDQALTSAQQAHGAGADPVECAQLVSLSLTQLGRFDHAIDAAKQALRAAPDVAFNHHVIGYAFYRQAVSMRPTAHWQLREDTVYARSLAMAERAYREAMRIEPAEALFHETLGFVLWEKDDNDAAERVLLEALRLDPNRPDCFRLLSEMCRSAGRYEEAHRHALQALSLDADRAGSHASLGWARLMHGDAASALGIFQESMRLNPNDDYARQGMIEALKVQNRFVRLPYRLLTRVTDLSNSARWRRTTVILWPIIALAVFVLVLVIQRDVGQAVAGLFAGVVIGGFVVMLGMWLPWMSWYLLSVCNAVLIPHPLGRHALTASQRCSAVASIAYPLPVIGALLLYLALGGDTMPRWGATLVNWVVGSALLAAPLALWAAALTTRWALPAGIIAGLSAGLYVLAMLGVFPFVELRDTPWPHALLAAGFFGCLLIPSRL